MDLKTHSEDVLGHIEGVGEPSPQMLASVTKPPEGTLEAKTAVSESCITLFSLAGASIKVCYAISGDNITVSAKLSTPFGDITLGKAVINAKNPTITLGGGLLGFKAEVTVTYDVSAATLTIKGTLCAPGAGCTSGSTTIHF